LILIMTAVAAGIGVAAIAILYHAALDEERSRLVETAQSQARLMEAVARFDEVYSLDYPEGSKAATIAQIKDAHERYLGFGETGEFTLARRVGDDIVFVLRHRHLDVDKPQPVPFDSNFAEPMRRALSGQSGTTIGLDYRGVTVLAAHEPVSVLDLGIVAKIDLVEIRASFLKAAAIVAVIATVLIASGTMLFFRVGNPIIRRIQASEERFRSMAASAQDAIISLDNEGCVTFWNSAAARMFGYDFEEILGRNLSAHVIPEPQRERHAVGLENFSLNGQGAIFGRTVELEAQKKDGQKFPVELSLSVTEIEDEWQATAIVRDITERWQAQAALKESEEKFRQILESAADAIIISDERGRILITNGQAERLFGYTRRELIGQPVELLVPKGLRERHIAERRDYCGHLTPRPMGTGLDLFARRKDGTMVPVDISLSPVHSEQGLMVTAIVHDISARMHTEARLRRLNRIYAVLSRCNHDLARASDEVELLSAFCRTLVEVGGYRFAYVGYAQYDKAKGVRLMAYAGHTDDEFSVIATGWSDMAVPRSPGGTAIRSAEPVVLQDIEKDPRFPLWRDAALRQGYRSMMALALRTDGQVLGDFSIYSTQRAAFDEEEVALLTELAGDLSFGVQTLRARAARAQKVRLLREEAERAEQKRLAATLHDGVGQTMQAVNLGLKRLRAVAKDKRPTGELLDRLIDDVGGVIAELRSVTQELRPPFLERMGLLGAVRYWCNVLAERSGIAIHVVSDDDIIQLDKRVKEQCFLIINEALNNVISHAQASRIDVEVETSGTGWLRIRIADNGRGFDPNQSWRAPSGLGLSMMSERAASVGGNVEVHSASGEGTVVSIRVPHTV
jgi:PAS domain S-box-containing protein